MGLVEAQKMKNFEGPFTGTVIVALAKCSALEYNGLSSNRQKGKSENRRVLRSLRARSVVTTMVVE
jgi:hypothetical protein